MRDANGADKGLVGSSRRILRTVAAMAQNRMELLLVEWQEERSRMFEMLLLAAGAVACSLMALITISYLLVVAVGEDYRSAVLVGLGLAYSLAAAIAFRQLSARLRDWQAFPAKPPALKKDCRWLDEKSEKTSDSASRP